MSVVRTIVVGVALLNMGLLLAAGSASAELSGTCTATIAGADPKALSSSNTDDAISVQEGSSVPWNFVATSEIVAWSSTLFYGPFSMEVDSGSDPADDEEPDLTRGGEAAVDDYAWMGVGLYKLEGAVSTDSGETCVGSVLINVEGNPLTTVVGGSAAVVTVGGAAGLGGAALSGLKGAGLLAKP